jgi:cold shock CspA family protein
MIKQLCLSALALCLLTGCAGVGFGFSYSENGTEFSAIHSDGKTTVSALKDGQKISIKVKKPNG